MGDFSEIFTSMNLLGSDVQSKRIEKTGICPKIAEGPENCLQGANGNCSSDFDCEGIQKCCLVTCELKCIQPIKVPGKYNKKIYFYTN